MRSPPEPSLTCTRPARSRDDLIRHEIKEAVAETTRQTPLAPRPAPKRPEFSAELLRYVACQRSAAVQAALLGHPRKAKEVAALILLLGFRTCIGARLTLHACHEVPADERAQRSYQAIEHVTAQIADRLGYGPAENGDPIARLIPSCGAVPLNEMLGRLADEDLDRLVVLLPILCFGEERFAGLDTGDTLFNRVAGDLGMLMRKWWTPDVTFLSGLVREQILAIAVECGAAGELKGLHGWTKKQLVEELARYFAEKPAAEDADRAAAEWLPGFFRFPAMKTLTGSPPPA